MPKITTNMPMQCIDITRIKLHSNVQLADPEFYRSRPVDMLIGAEIFWNILLTNKIPQTRKNPHFQEIKLGWIAGGTINSINTQIISCNLNANLAPALETQVAKFWEIEEVCNDPILSIDDTMCKQQFKQNYRRQSDGRFIVPLPLKRITINLGNSYKTAAQRFYNLERKLSTQAQIKQMYVAFLREYEQLGHMKLVTNPDENKNNSYYLPHRC